MLYQVLAVTNGAQLLDFSGYVTYMGIGRLQSRKSNVARTQNTRTPATPGSAPIVAQGIELMSDLPPELAAFASLLDAQPAPARGRVPLSKTRGYCTQPGSMVSLRYL